MNYYELKNAGAKISRTSWTDVTTAKELTPHTPPTGYAYVVHKFVISAKTASRYVFVDQDGNEVSERLWFGANSGASIKNQVVCTPEKRLFIKQDSAAEGSLQAWVSLQPVENLVITTTSTTTTTTTTTTTAAPTTTTTTAAPTTTTTTAAPTTTTTTAAPTTTTTTAAPTTTTTTAAPTTTTAAPTTTTTTAAPTTTTTAAPTTTTTTTGP